MNQRITFVVNSEPPELRVAELRDGRLFNVDIERGGQGLGCIYRGIIANVVPGMEAYFVDIGAPKKGLLHFKDCASLMSSKLQNDDKNRTASLRVGQSVMVQVARPPVGAKGPRLTLRLSLPGRFVVLVSSSDTAGVSRRIESETERTRLRILAEKLRPLDFGLIVRTEAEGITENQMRSDVEDLLRQMTGIQELFRSGTGPELLHRDLGLLGRIIRDRFNEAVEQVFVDSPEEYEFCRQILSSVDPGLVGRVSFYDKGRPIFEQFGVERALTRAQQKTITLPHGGSLVIEETEALTAVDVNTGRFVGKTRLADTILQTNLEAVEEVALQLRLRGIGGIIVIDFIDMERTRDRIRVLDELQAALKEDRVKTHIVHLSPSGLVEITRRREGPSLRQLLNRPCASCGGGGVVKAPDTVAIQARRQLRQLAGQNPGRYFRIKMHPAVACHLIGSGGQFARQMENSLGTKVIVRVDRSLHIESTQIEVLSDETDARETPMRFTLGMHDVLYPEEAPEFAVCDDLLVLLPAEIPVDEHQLKIQNVMVLEIESIGRWFAVARLARRT